MKNAHDPGVPESTHDGDGRRALCRRAGHRVGEPDEGHGIA